MAKADSGKIRERYEKAKTAYEEDQRKQRAKRRREKVQTDARRETLIGKMVLHHVQANPHQHDRLMTQLDAFLTDAKDRALFDLPSKNSASASAVPNGPQVPAEDHGEPPRP